MFFTLAKDFLININICLEGFRTIDHILKLKRRNISTYTSEHTLKLIIKIDTENKFLEIS